MREDLVRMQAQQDELTEQLAGLQVAAPRQEAVARPEASPEPPAAPPRLERPRLKVIKLVPDTSSDQAMGHNEESDSSAPVQPTGREEP